MFTCYAIWKQITSYFNCRAVTMKRTYYCFCLTNENSRLTYVQYESTVIENSRAVTMKRTYYCFCLRNENSRLTYVQYESTVILKIGLSSHMFAACKIVNFKNNLFKKIMSLLITGRRVGRCSLGLEF